MLTANTICYILYMYYIMWSLLHTLYFIRRSVRICSDSVNYSHTGISSVKNPSKTKSILLYHPATPNLIPRLPKSSKLQWKNIFQSNIFSPYKGRAYRGDKKEAYFVFYFDVQDLSRVGITDDHVEALINTSTIDPTRKAYPKKVSAYIKGAWMGGPEFGIQ